MKNDDPDKVTIRDASGRRTFMRQGTAFLLTTSALGSASQVLADECDRGSTDPNVKKGVAGSDSDSGSNADRAGCGKLEEEIPATLDIEFKHDGLQSETSVKRLKSPNNN